MRFLHSSITVQPIVHLQHFDHLQLNKTAGNTAGRMMKAE